MNNTKEELAKHGSLAIGELAIIIDELQHSLDLIEDGAYEAAKENLEAVDCGDIKSVIEILNQLI